LSEPVPIACTLSAGDVRQRLAWIADLNQRRLLRHRRDDLTLSLVYDREAGPDVDRFVAQERECCPFLAFRVEDGADGIVMTVTAPEAAREAAATLFDGFTGGQPAARACGCC
jgi:hypothetical protein